MNQTAVVPRLDLVGGRPVATSLNVADVFGKQHKLVMRAVRALDVPDDFARCNFAPGSYLDAQNQPRPMYHVTRDGFTLLAMGFTGARAMHFKLAYIEAFNRMEAELHGGRGRRTDIHHHRGPVSGSGLDIRYTLDLTKVVLRPTAQSLLVLHRLTGIEVGDLVDELAAVRQGLRDGDGHAVQVGRYLAEAVECADGCRVRLKDLCSGYNQWRQSVDGSGELDIRSFGRSVRLAGFAVEKKGGTYHVMNVCLVEVA